MCNQVVDRILKQLSLVSLFSKIYINEGYTTVFLNMMDVKIRGNLPAFWGRIPLPLLGRNSVIFYQTTRFYTALHSSLG